MYVRQRVGSGGVPKLPVIGKSPGSGGRGAKAARLYSDNNENRGPPAPARGATSEDPEVELLNYIKTGDDVVVFYARQGKESEVKFFYCNRADTGIFFRPYDLEVVAREEVNPEYFTISASGVVHLQAGARAEFSPLGEWMREKSIFNVFTRMKFFKHYLVYKCYHSWRSSVRQKLFAQVSSFGVVCGPRCV